MYLATYPHYAAHLAPIEAVGVPGDVVLVAGHGDLVEASRRHRRIVLAQHGAGQSYSSRHPHYAGGDGNGAASLFLAPNDHSADRWRRAYPGTPVATVGSPILDTLPAREPGPGGPVVAFAFHWDLHLCPETLSALPWYVEALPTVAATYLTIGTGHPRRHDLGHVYDRAGMEYVPSLGEVCRRADVLVFDNTSAGFEFASTGRPVVVLDAPWYRPAVDHGLRFWDAAHVGVRVTDPADLLAGIERALERRPGDEDAREDALSRVYAYRTGAAVRAAEAIAAYA